MGTDSPTQPQNSFFGWGLSLYRRTLKRFKPFHVALHWVMTNTLIPFLEARQNFRTMPDDPFWFRLELLTNRHETDSTPHLSRLIQPNMTVLDIGGHVGYYTRLMSQLVGEKGRVVTFEPHPRNHAVLLENVGKRANVTVKQVALAETEGTAELYDYLMMSASGSLHYDEKIRDVQRATLSDWDVAPRMKDFTPQKFSVRTAPVDALLAELGIEQVDVIKMDIEGAELGALRGMKRTIERSRPLALLMEYNPLGLQAFGHDPIQALEEVLSMGFDRLYVIQPDSTLKDYTHKHADIQALTDQLVKNMGVVNLLIQRGNFS